MKVGLFIPCYVNAVYPNIGIACYKLLTSLGIDVDYPLGQTCCGQPMANAGAKRFEQLFKNYTYVVGPSASCVAFIKENHPRILSEHGEHVCETSKHIYDITEFLHDVVKPERFASRFPHKVSLHNSCHGVRELHLSSASELTIPYYNKIRDLLEKVQDITVVEPERIDECCGSIRLYGTRQSKISYGYRSRIYHRRRQLLSDAYGRCY